MLDNVMQAMEQLSESNRVVLALVCVDGLSYKEAAMTLDVPVGTVMSRLARARVKLNTLIHGSKEIKGSH
jgi:RNA polymerase sigma-70 factor (ECF subfamily)